MDIKKIDAEKEFKEGAMSLGKGARGFQEEFLEFLKKYQVIGLAVAFIIGTAATALVTAMVKDIIMPVIAVIIPGGDWLNSAARREWASFSFDPAADGSLASVMLAELARIGQYRLEELKRHNFFALIEDGFNAGHPDILNHP
jgi:hypothetical protein